jgi:trigger factor
VQEKLLEAQPEVEIKGFRKGKVPLAMLKKQFGPRILGDAMQDAIDGAMKDHFEKSGDRPALQPEGQDGAAKSWKEGSGCRGRDDLRSPAADPGLSTLSKSSWKAGREG